LFGRFPLDRAADAVFDPIGAPTSAISRDLLAPRGCLIHYGELPGAPAFLSTAPPTHTARRSPVRPAKCWSFPTRK